MADARNTAARGASDRTGQHHLAAKGAPRPAVLEPVAPHWQLWPTRAMRLRRHDPDRRGKEGSGNGPGIVSPTMDATARLHFCAVAVIVTVALKYACPPLAESGGAGVVQARAPAQLPEGCAAIRHWFGDARARPDLALLAQIAVSRHSGHLPLNRQAVVMARHRVAIGRSTLADRMGRTGCGDRAR